jgi:hypothetical protein
MKWSSASHALVLRNSLLGVEGAQFANLSAGISGPESKASTPFHFLKSVLRMRRSRRKSCGQSYSSNLTSQSVRPKSKWQTQSFSAFLAALKEKREMELSSESSASSWDGLYASGLSTMKEQLSEVYTHTSASRTSAVGDDWDLQSDSGCSDASSVEVWPPRMERQRAVAIIEREFKEVYEHSQQASPVSVRNMLIRQGAMKAPEVNSHASIPFVGRRWNVLLPGAGKKHCEEFAASMVHDTFLAYQAGALARQMS